MLRVDLKRARERWIAAGTSDAERSAREQSSFLAYRDEAGDVCDFHSFRHTFISRIVAGGASVKVAQDLARHSSPVLTIGRYAHSRLHDLRDALDGLPSLTPHTETEAATLAATGTDNASPNPADRAQHWAQQSGRFSVRLGATRGDDPCKEPETVDRRKSLPDKKKGDVERRLARECERGPGESRTHAGGFAIRSGVYRTRCTSRCYAK
jgi:hypothetical protein